MPCYHGRVIRCPLPDRDLTIGQIRHAIVCGVTVAQAVVNGRRVLVTCRAGLNRAALIVGIALGQLTTMPAEDVIDLIRTRRSQGALSNQTFVELLRRLVGDGRPRARARRPPRRED